MLYKVKQVYKEYVSTEEKLHQCLGGFGSKRDCVCVRACMLKPCSATTCRRTASVMGACWNRH